MSRIHKLQVDVKRAVGGSGDSEAFVSSARKLRHKAHRRGSGSTSTSMNSTMLTSNSRMIIDKGGLYLSLKPHEGDVFEDINLNAVDANTTPVNEVASGRYVTLCTIKSYFHLWHE